MGIENYQNINSSEKTKIVIASVDIERQARDVAEEKLSSSREELRGFSGFFKKIWKHNLAHEYYRQKEIAKAKREIKQSGNLYVGEEGDKADHDFAMESIVKRFEAEYENENLLRQGEEKRKLEDGNANESQLKKEISDLIGRYAKGEINEEDFQLEKNNLYETYLEDKKKPSVFADNLLEIAKQIKENIAHGATMDLLDDEFDFVIGKARAGVETEAQYNAVDKITEKIQKSFLGSFVNEATVASAVAIAYGAIAKGVVSTSQRAAKLVGPLGMGLSAGIGGAVAGIRENKRLKDERAQHMREMAKGKIFEKDSTRRQELEKYRYETRSAIDLTENLQENLEKLKSNPNELSLSEILNSINEIEARLSFSEQKNIDLISFSDSKKVESERTKLLVASAEAKVFIKKNINQGWATFFNSSQEFSQYLEHAREAKINNDFLIEKDIKDKAFNKMKQKKVALEVTKGLTIGLGVGMAVQEIGSAIGNGTECMFDESMKSGNHHYTALGFLRHYISGDLPHDQVVSHFEPGKNISSITTTMHENAVKVKDFAKEHENMFTKIRRDCWADNNTLKPDKNELKLWWGGENASGMDNKGNYVFNINHMTHDGSFHGSKHFDPIELMKEGKMKILVSLSGDTQNQVVEIPIDKNGNAIIDPNSEIGKIAFKNVDGHAKFLGKFAEVAVMGEKINGTQHINVLATQIGKGVENIKQMVEQKNISSVFVPPRLSETIIHSDYDVQAPYVIPMAPRKPMEKMIYGQKNANRSGDEDYPMTPTDEFVGPETPYTEEPLAEFVGPITPYTQEPSKKFVGPKTPYTQNPPKQFMGPIMPQTKESPDNFVGPMMPTSQEQPVQIVENTQEELPKLEKRNWWEVKREAEVMAIEDLDGDINLFEKHIARLGVANKDNNGNWQWTGGNKKLIFLGDILGDRKTEGIAITSIIGDLAQQAEKQGGQIEQLCGNHDITFIAFLCKGFGAKINHDAADSLTVQSTGIWELVQFDPDFNSELKNFDPLIRNGDNTGMVSEEFRQKQEELWGKLYERVPHILENMRADKKGRKILEDVCRIKIATIKDDTLFCHTDPEFKMVKELFDGGDVVSKVAEINQVFQKELRNILIDGGEPADEFWNLENMYLNANNRKNFAEDEAFEDIAQDLLSIVAKNLYKNGNIRIDDSQKKEFDEVGVEQRNWTGWSFWMLQDETQVSFDENNIISSLSEWKKKNNITGDYTDEILDIMKKISVKNIRYGTVRHNLEEKIKNLNPVEDNVEKVKGSGINAIVHGHSPINYRFFEKNGFMIISPHSSFEQYNSTSSGVLTIQKNGRMDFVGKSFREQIPTASNQSQSQEKLDQQSFESELRKIRTDFGVDIQGDQVVGSDNNKEIVENLRKALSDVDLNELKENVKMIALRNSASGLLVGNGENIGINSSLSSAEMANDISRLIAESKDKQFENARQKFASEVPAQYLDVMANVQVQMDRQGVSNETQKQFTEALKNVLGSEDLAESVKQELVKVKLNFLRNSAATVYPQKLGSVSIEDNGDINVYIGSDDDVSNDLIERWLKEKVNELG